MLAARIPGSLVGGYRHANAAATDENATLRRAGGNAAGDRVSKVRVIAGVTGGRAAILDRIAQTLQVELELFFQFVTGVIGTHRDSHKGILPR